MVIFKQYLEAYISDCHDLSTDLNNYEFSKNYSDVSSCPILIIFELAQTELKEVILCNCNIVK
jgi:hypothetical protein